jgi:hypothetical protein
MDGSEQMSWQPGISVSEQEDLSPGTVSSQIPDETQIPPGINQLNNATIPKQNRLIGIDQLPGSISAASINDDQLKIPPGLLSQASEENWQMPLLIQTWSNNTYHSFASIFFLSLSRFSRA